MFMLIDASGNYMDITGQSAAPSSGRNPMLIPREQLQQRLAVLSRNFNIDDFKIVLFVPEATE